MGSRFFNLNADQEVILDWIAGSCQATVLQTCTGLGCSEASLCCKPRIKKVNQRINFSYIEMFFTTFVYLADIETTQIQTEGQTMSTENFTIKVPDSKQNSPLYPGLA